MQGREGKCLESWKSRGRSRLQLPPRGHPMNCSPELPDQFPGQTKLGMSTHSSDRVPQADSLPTQNDNQQATCLYCLSLHLTQERAHPQPLAQGRSGWESPDSLRWGCHQRPQELRGCVSSSTAPLADRYPVENRGCEALGCEQSWVSFLSPWPLCPRPILGPVAGWKERITSLNRLQGNVLRRAARWAGSSAGSFRLFCSSRCLSARSSVALPLCREGC